MQSSRYFPFNNGKGSGTTYHLAKPEFSMQLQGELQHRSCTGFPAVPRLSVTRTPYLLFLFIVFIISIITGNFNTKVLTIQLLFISENKRAVNCKNLLTPKRHLCYNHYKLIRITAMIRTSNYVNFSSASR